VTDDRQTDRQMTDKRATAYSERERNFTFAKNNVLFIVGQKSTLVALRTASWQVTIGLSMPT